MSIYIDELKDLAYYNNGATPFVLLIDAVSVVRKLESKLNEKEQDTNTNKERTTSQGNS
jgi:hypothetical protein